LLYILLGEDEFSLHANLEEIKRGLGDPALLSANTSVLEGQFTPDQLRLATETIPFLAEKRLVIVQGLLGRFEPPKGRPARGKKAAPPSAPRNDHTPFLEAISKRAPSTVLVLMDSEIGRNNPLLKELSGRAEVRSFPRPKGEELKQWIRKRVAGEGGTIAPEAVGLLAQLVGGNLRLMASEINKLALFVSGRRIEESDVKQMVSYAQEANIFAMVDAVLGFNPAQAERLLHQLLQGGASSSHILAMLARQARLMVRAKELKRQGLPDVEIQSRLGLADFPFRKTLEQASRYSWERIKDVYRKLLETDLAIKTGRYGDELALSIMVAELCQPVGQRA